MGRHVVRSVGELGRGLVLAPERFDPRRRLAVAATRRLSDVVAVTTGNLAPSSLPPAARALVLDTTHAWEGFVLARHAPVAPAQISAAYFSSLDLPHSAVVPASKDAFRNENPAWHMIVASRNSTAPNQRNENPGGWSQNGSVAPTSAGSKDALQ